MYVRQEIDKQLNFVKNSKQPTNQPIENRVINIDISLNFYFFFPSFFFFLFSVIFKSKKKP